MRIQLSDERQEMLEMVRQSAKDFAEKNYFIHLAGKVDFDFVRMELKDCELEFPC